MTETILKTRLKEGMKVRISSGVYVVTFVNESRAHIVPVGSKKKSFSKLNGDHVEFESQSAGKDISPNSECEIISFNEQLKINNEQSEQRNETMQ